jgi:hypothetical protein
MSKQPHKQIAPRGGANPRHTFILGLILWLMLAVLVFPSLALANPEHRATVLMRSGDRVAGLLEDVERGTVYVRVSEHDQRKLNIGDVALLDFVGGASGLPETELAVARGSQHLVLLRNGSSWTGQFIDIRGGEATAAPGESHILYFRMPNGEERRTGLDAVSRIYLGNFPGAATAASKSSTYTSGEPQPAGAIRVPGNVTWTATPLSVRRGDQVRFSVSGRIQLSDDPEDVAHAAGSLRQRLARGAPLPQNLAGALIARVGNSAPFPIGDVTTPVAMPAAGQLYLGINDDEVSDNRGEYIVTLSPMQTRRR